MIIEVNNPFLRELREPNEKFGYSAGYVLGSEAVYLTREAAERDATRNQKWQNEKNLRPDCRYIVRELKEETT